MQDETYFYAEAILDINPKAAFWLKENDLNQLEWFDETTPIPDDPVSYTHLTLPTILRV